MTEPLKNKLINYVYPAVINNHFRKNDVRSAADWLIERLREITLPGDIKFREELIKEAFADAYQEKE